MGDILKTCTDEELVTKSLENSRNFSELVFRYQDKLAFFVKRRGKFSREDIEDILQNVFIKIYLNLNDFDTDLKFSSWAYRICYNELVSEYRKKSIREHISLDEDEESGIINFVASEIDVPHLVHMSNFKNDFEKALNELPDKYREILSLRLLDEKDYEEISDILKQPIGTISSNILRGKKLLKEKLEHYNNQVKN